MRLLLAILMFLATPAFSFDANEMRCLALNIYFEARGESPEGQMAVAHTTLNRVNNDHYSNTICEVIQEPDQFSWYWDGKSDKPRDADAWENANAIANVSVRWYAIGEDFSKGATHYHATYVKPYWAKLFNKTVQIDRHIFYEEVRK